MKIIRSAKGIEVFVDDDIFEKINGRSIRVDKDYPEIGNSGIKLHIFIMGRREGFIIDHIDRNPLNNLRSNLRFVTAFQNTVNSKPRNGARYKGVSLRKETGKYRSKITYSDKSIRLGDYESDTKAAMVYDEAARILFGEYAYLNFPDISAGAILSDQLLNKINGIKNSDYCGMASVEKNIYYRNTKSGSRYCVDIKINRIPRRKTFSSLEEARSYRDELITQRTIF
jgi:hypothetical protein